MVEAKLLRKKLKNGLIVDKWDLVAIIEKQQAENDALQAKYEADYAKAFENGYAIGLSHGKDLVNNG